MVHLTPLPAGGIGAADVDVPAAIPSTEEERAALDFLGPLLPDDVAGGIASGEGRSHCVMPGALAAAPARSGPHSVAVGTRHLNRHSLWR
jgi:hypothetical protein